MDLDTLFDDPTTCTEQEQGPKKPKRKKRKKKKQKKQKQKQKQGKQASPAASPAASPEATPEVAPAPAPAPESTLTACVARLEAQVRAAQVAPPDGAAGWTEDPPADEDEDEDEDEDAPPEADLVSDEAGYLYSPADLAAHWEAAWELTRAGL